MVTDKTSRHKRKIIRQLYFDKILSCAELSIKTDRSFPLTGRLLSELIDEGSVVETGYAPSTGGRRPLMYSLKADMLYTVSVAMDQFVTRIALMNMENGYVTGTERFELQLAKNSKALPLLTERIAKFISRLKIDKGRIAGIGIGMPGFVDVKKGVNYSFLPNDNKSITEYIARKVELPVFIDNDSSLIALAELRFGAARSKKDAMVVNIGWGIGLGMIVNGELFRGHNGFAGEFSHIPLFTNNKLCSCGKRGCLETETSLLTITEKMRKSIKSGKVSALSESAEEDLEQASNAILTAATKGDQFAVELLSEAGYNIGKGVAILIHIMNPEAIILSGRGAAAGKIWQTPVQQAINEHCIPRIAANTTIELSTLGHHAELIGAAALVMENYERPSIKNHLQPSALTQN